MKYWRCSLGPLLGWLWPMFGHLIKIEYGYAYCTRCPWREKLPDWEALHNR